MEKKAQTTDLEKLGGLAKIMPISFLTFLIAAFAISGVPPFNGFVSKWMVYQGVVEAGRSGGGLWIVWLIAAIFGSALTLASFMKAVHAVFLGQPYKKPKVISHKLSEVGPSMWIPSVILAGLCIIFGVFAYRIPLGMFVFPSLGGEVMFSGVWNAGLATILILSGIVIGIVIYLLGTVTKTRESKVFVGGEDIEDYPQMRISGTKFYNTIQQIGFLKNIYRLAEKRVFDLYDLGAKITFGFTNVLRRIHNGVLPTYLAWCLLGMGILFFILILR